MSKKLENKVAIITGGARGMGASHARRFVAEGAKVVITDILEKEGKAVADELGEHAIFIKHDVTKWDEWQHVVSTAESTFGPVNILINNAGIGFVKLIEEITEEEYRKTIDINQVSVFLGMKAVVSSMKQTKKGSIVNISSVAGLLALPQYITYSASKFAVRGMTKVGALEFADYGIRVNSVHPGLIDTPMTRDENNAASLAEFAKSIPLKRAASPEEVTNLVLYLASDDSSYSTGSEFVIDGGISPF